MNREGEWPPEPPLSTTAKRNSLRWDRIGRRQLAGVVEFGNQRWINAPRAPPPPPPLPKGGSYRVRLPIGVVWNHWRCSGGSGGPSPSRAVACDYSSHCFYFFAESF